MPLLRRQQSGPTLQGSSPTLQGGGPSLQGPGNGALADRLRQSGGLSVTTGGQLDPWGRAAQDGAQQGTPLPALGLHTRGGLLRHLLDGFVSCVAGEETMERLAQRGVDAGILTAQGSLAAYRLEDPATRAETAAMVVRTFGLSTELPAGEVAYFADVEPSAWFYDTVHAARRHGIFKGYGGTNEMRPEAALSESAAKTIVERLPPAGPLAPEAQVDGTQPITDPDKARSIEIDVPFFSQRIGGPDFAKGDYQCFYASKSMAENTQLDDGSEMDVMGRYNIFKLATAQAADGTITLDEGEAETALDYVDAELEAGRPVVVGVNYKDSSYDHENADGITDHFVVIKGRTGSGPGATYTFQDPWPLKQEDAIGEFQREKDGRLVYTTEDKGEMLSTRYVVAMVRMNDVKE
jgi:hypothetical protein